MEKVQREAKRRTSEFSLPAPIPRKKDPAEGMDVFLL
jgi:hypothetical protein